MRVSKWLALGLALALVLGLTSACGTGSTAATTTCEDVGQVVVAMPPALGLQPPTANPASVRVYVSYSAKNLRTGAQITAGSKAPSPWAYWCNDVTFSGRTAGDLSTGPAPAGSRSTDLFTGRYIVTVDVAVPPPAGTSAPPTRPFPTNGQLAAYLATRPGNVAVAAFDAVTGSTYAYGPRRRYRTASTIKAAILGTLLLRAQDARRPLTATENQLAARMIDYSDNAATDALWSEIGCGAGMARFAGKIGMTGIVPGPDKFWIVTETTAVDEVWLMRALAYPNAVLSDASRAYALGLMSHVTPTQRWGVSAAAQPGEQVALKNGWIIPLGGWATHSIGRVWGARRDFVLAVMSFASPTKAVGVATTEEASRIAARLLARR
ncbi:MAG: serine hydrolase [Frankiaceae bacterium]